MQLFKKKAYTLYYEDVIPGGPTADAILWDFSYTSTPYISAHVLSISAPANSPTYASVTSNGAITTWVGNDINIQVLASTGDASAIYSSITVTRQSRVFPFSSEPVNTIGGDCIVTNNNINLTIPDYDPAYQYTISGVVEPCTVPWNSLTALRESFDTSTQNSPITATACGYDIGSWDNLYLATQTPNTVHVGDRVFTSDLPGITTFDGTDILGNPSYWVITLFGDIEINCPGSKRLAKIDQGGFIVELQCCPII